jgi:RNA polymerase sigma-70 factor (ECF subfamily)
MSEQVEQLCERARAGELEAASELVALFHERVFAFFRRLCGNQADAEDLTQKTFARLWSSLGKFKGQSSFSTWLHGIGYHVYVDWRRKGNRHESREESWWEERASEEPSPFEDVADRDLAGRVYALVEALEEGSREVVHLHYYQGLSLHETAEVLGIATSTVKYRLREALARLKAGVGEPAIRTKL